MTRYKRKRTLSGAQGVGIQKVGLQFALRVEPNPATYLCLLCRNWISRVLIPKDATCCVGAAGPVFLGWDACVDMLSQR